MLNRIGGWGIPGETFVGDMQFVKVFSLESSPLLQSIVIRDTMPYQGVIDSKPLVTGAFIAVVVVSVVVCVHVHAVW